MAHELHDALEDPEGVVIVEWGEVVQDVLPEERLTITITKTADDGRELVCEYPDTLEYLVG
jgi:tRNA A37 threonylcarbamoyladenosine biosynthesis protein TsaE